MRSLQSALCCLAVLAAGTGLAAAAPADPAAPWVGSVSWTTFLHEGPGLQWRVEDELDTATEVDVLGCANGWCKVAYDGAYGYLLRDVLTPASAGPAEQPKQSQDCFDARRAGAGNGKLFTFCVH